MVGLELSIPRAIRKAALHVAGYVEMPYGGDIGHRESEEDGYRRMLRNFRLLHYPHDPRLRHWSALTTGSEDRQATPEQVAFQLEQQRLDLEKFGLVYAVPDDPDAFCVKWKARPESEWAETFMRDVAEGREVRHG